ncbi:hypothetical protein P3W45_000265 [Vairimorpha bombi]|jgi:D-aminoacyl-tRNA deacylase
MKIVIQKAKNARYINNNELISSIEEGLVLFVGITKFDTLDTLNWCAKKILSLKLYNNWTQNIIEKDLELLVLSQYTILAKFDGTKPSFNEMMDKNEAKQIFDKFIEILTDQYNEKNIKRGMFGAKPEVTIVNDGPFTAIIEK